MRSATTSSPTCRLCGAALTHSFIDLGEMPLANALLTPEQLDRPEPKFPLHARVCGECFLVQVDAVVCPEQIFRDYPYFSSYSSSWVEHARAFVEGAVKRFGLDSDSLIVEVGSNDGYLLRHVVRAGIPCLGVEPVGDIAAAAQALGVPSEIGFLTRSSAQTLKDRGVTADLLVANNVLGHVPDIHDFVAGLAMLLKPSGVLSVEIPHVLRLIEDAQFDTIYHEHFCYFSLACIERLLREHGLTVFDVEELPTHGGSLRVLAAPAGGHRAVPGHLSRVRSAEHAAGLDGIAAYSGFGLRAQAICRDLRAFLDDALRHGRSVAAYGAAAKGNTLLNACGIGASRIAFVADKNVHKQGNFTPGTHVPIRAPQAVFERRPDYLLILPWNLREEIVHEMAGIRTWGGRFVLAAPRLEVLS
jgi:SAM-dependent methyltransferase